MWNPASVTRGTAQIYLGEDPFSVLTDMPRVNGTVGACPGGKLSFSDADGDGCLCMGDLFVIHGNPTSRHMPMLPILFATVGLALTP